MNSVNSNANVLFPPDHFIYPLIGFFAGSCAVMFIIILLLWFTIRRARNKSKSKDAKPTHPIQGIIKTTTSKCKNISGTQVTLPDTLT